MLGVLKSTFCAARSMIRPAMTTRTVEQTTKVLVTAKRFESNYDPYSNYEAQSPYKARRGIRRFYEYKLYTGGLLPRPKGEWEDVPLPMPPWDPAKKDGWTAKKALFGQNDYIDILGDGTIHPWELLRAPAWLKGYKGNELQRISRQLAMQGTFLRETFPSKYHTLQKELFFLYKRFNRRRHTPYRGGYNRYSRIDKPKERF